MTGKSKLVAFLTGDTLARAEALSREGKRKEAMELFAKGGNFTRAARLAAHLGDEPAAVRFSLQAVLGDGAGAYGETTALQAGEILATAGHHKEALFLFELGGGWAQAARSALKLKQEGRAARYYEKARQWERAALYHRRAGAKADALRALEHHARYLQEELRGNRDGGNASHLLETDMERAELLLELGREDEAQAILDASPPSLQGAQLLERRGRGEAALKMYLALEDPRRALPLLKTFPHINVKLAAKVLVACGHGAEAGRRLAAKGWSLDAAEAFESARRWKEAAQAWRSGRQPDRAAKALEKAGDLAGAAALWAEAGEPKKAALLYRKAGVTSGLSKPPEEAPRKPEPASAPAPTPQVAAPSVPQTPGLAATRPDLAATSIPHTPGGGLAIGYMLAGRYQILGDLGRGGMGRVYRAFDREVEDAVAIKTLLRAGPDQKQEEARLLREVQICRKLTHPNIVRVFDLGRLDGELQGQGLFVTMELLEGEPLSDRLEASAEPAEALPLEQLRKILLEVLAGLAEAHQQGVVHRDLKPSNIFLTPQRVKILDFGIARMAAFEEGLTQTGLVPGSPHYMSPEQLRGAELDGRSDLYSLGVVAYTLLAGHEPFIAAPSVGEVLLAHLQKEPPRIRETRSDLPPGWASWLDRLLAKDPGARFPDADAAAEALRDLTH